MQIRDRWPARANIPLPVAPSPACSRVLLREAGKQALGVGAPRRLQCVFALGAKPKTVAARALMSTRPRMRAHVITDVNQFD